MRHRPLLAALVLLTAACRPSIAEDAASVEVVAGPLREVFDGQTDDLLTAGLGIEGLRVAPPQWSATLQESWRERRRRAIAQNWRSLADLREQSGFGRTYGPLGSTGIAGGAGVAGIAGIAGTEYLALLRQPGGKGVFTVWLQVPTGFDPSAPCLAVVASSGSRGIFGALPTAAARVLQRGCAVVHNDKGLGTGIVDLEGDRGLSFDGRVISLQENDPASLWQPPGATTAPAATTAPHAPHTIALKHAHSGELEEARWGEMLVAAGRYGLQLLNEELRLRGAPSANLEPANTLILALGISNGGAAVLQALERDGGNFFDGAAVAEPNAQVPGIAPLYEYAAFHALYQPCAILAENLAEIPLGAVVASNPAPFQAWCAQLAAADRLVGDDVATQADAARQILSARGVRPEALRLGMLNLQFGLWPSVLTTYASAYARSPIGEMPCGASFAAIDAQGRPRALQPIELAHAYTDATGIAPTAGVAILAKDATGERSLLAANGFSFIFCLAEQSAAFGRSLRDVRVEVTPGERPLVIVHGRDDALIPVALSSRAYGSILAHMHRADRFHYYEVLRAQHFDAFLALPGMQGHRPLQPHFDAAVDALLASLRTGAPLPPSQVVRTEILADPPADSRIVVRNRQLEIPE